MTRDEMQALAVAMKELLIADKGSQERTQLSEDLKIKFSSLFRTSIDLAAHHTTESANSTLDKITNAWNILADSNDDKVNAYIFEKFSALTIYMYLKLTVRLATENIAVIIERDMLPTFISKENLDRAIGEVQFMTSSEIEESEQ